MKFNNPQNFLGVFSSDPAFGREGQTYYNSTDNEMKVYDGGWGSLGGGGSSFTFLSEDANMVILEAGGTTERFRLISPSGEYYSPKLTFKQGIGGGVTSLFNDFNGDKFIIETNIDDIIALGGSLGVLGKVNIQGYPYQTGGIACNVRTVDAGTVGLEIELASGQTANAFEVNSNGGSDGDLAFVNSSGQPKFTGGTPSSASDTGIAGQILWDASYIYICTATNTWKRAAIATW